MKIHLSGHLNWYDAEKRTWFDLQVEDQTRLVNLLVSLGIPQGEVAIIVLNGVQVDLEDVVLKNDDVLELFPPISGG